MNKHRFTKFPAATLISAIWFGLITTFPSPAKAEIAIGVLTDITGKASPLGKQIELGVRLAKSTHEADTNAENIRLEVRDSACDPKQAQKAAVKLLRLNVKIVVGPICSDAMYAAIKVLSPAGITIISPFVRTTQITRGRKKQGWKVFSLAGDAKSEVTAISKILLDRWQGKAYAIADDGSIYGRGLADDFRTLAELSGQKPVALANYRPLQSNQISMLRRLKKSGMEALFVGGDAVDIAQITRDAEKTGMDIEIAGGESVALLPIEDEAATVPRGLLAVMPLAPFRLPAAAGLVSSLKRQDIATGGGIIPGYALMQIAMIVAANNEKLENQVFNTVLGQVRFSEQGFASAYPYQLHVWTDGQIKPLSGY